MAENSNEDARNTVQTPWQTGTECLICPLPERHDVRVGDYVSKFGTLYVVTSLHKVAAGWVAEVEELPKGSLYYPSTGTIEVPKKFF